MRLRGFLVVVPLLGLGTPASALTREEIAKKHAPVFHQEVRDEVRDLYAAYDFDGNWAGDDNKQNVECVKDASKCAGLACASGACKLVGTVYFTVIETATHWFVQYLPYHPLDTKQTNGHEHDTESVLAVVAKDGSEGGKLLAIETRFHSEWFTYAEPSVKSAASSPNGPVHRDAKGRSQVYSQQVGHGICGGFSPPNNIFPDLQLSCNHTEAPHIAGTGVVYEPDLPATQPVVVDGQAVHAGYALVEIYGSFWSRRAEVGPGKTFKELIDFDGARCSVLACPKQFGGAFMGDDGSPPGGPWSQEGGAGVSAKGSQFFDPADTMKKRLAFPEPFSLDYCHNPYVGVDDKCPAATPESTVPPTPSGRPDPGAEEPAGDAAIAPHAGCGCRSAPNDDAAGVLAGAVIAVMLAGRRRVSRGSSGSRRP
jgi:MYXO-CTERM domain-containing protein